MTSVTIRSAGFDDLAAIVSITNAAFAVERSFKRGERTTPDMIRSMMSKARFLLADDADGRLVGSVYVELRGTSVYIGMLSVDPSRQKSGLGRAMMDAAEAYGRGHRCATADITIVNLRTELPPFYRGRGYVDTGTALLERPEDFTRDAHFIRMSKRL